MMESTLNIEDFFARPTVKDCCRFIDTTESVSNCAAKHVEELVDLSKEDLVYSSDSFRSVLEEDGHDPFRFYEAELRTYPTKFLTKSIVKLFTDEFGVGMCWFSLKLSEPKKGEMFVKDYKDDIYVYDRALNKYLAFESFESSGQSYCLVKADAKYIEGDVAGKVIYVVRFPDAKRLDKTALSNSFIKRLIECGEQNGYDYIANGKIAFNNALEFTVSFESKYQQSEIEIEDTLYHIAPFTTKDKILKFGLNPHGEDYSKILQNRISKRMQGINVRMHPYRVYLFNGYDAWAMKSFIEQLRLEKKYNDKCLEKLRNASKFAVFEVDRKKVPHLKLYRDNNFESKDPRHPTALYTYTNVPPSALKFKTAMDAIQ